MCPTSTMSWCMRCVAASKLAACVHLCVLLTMLPPLQAVVLGIERSSANSLELIVALLSHLYQAGIVTKDQMQQVGVWGVQVL